MRQMKARDVFPAIRLVNMLNMKEEIAEMRQAVSTANGAVDAEKTGFDFLFRMLEKASNEKMEKAVFEFLAGPMETTVNELMDMDLIDLIQTIRNDFDWENWNNFFSTVKSAMEQK